MTTHAPLRSQRTKAKSVCHVRGLGGGDSPTSPLVKIQGYLFHSTYMQSEATEAIREAEAYYTKNPIRGDVEEIRMKLRYDII